MKKNVLKSFVALAALTFGSNALADGFSASLGAALSPGNPSYFSVGGSLGYSLEVVPLLTVSANLALDYTSGGNLTYLRAGIGAEYLYGLTKTTDLKIDLPVGADVSYSVLSQQDVAYVSSSLRGDVYTGIDVQYLASRTLKVNSAGRFSINLSSSAGLGFGLYGGVGLNYYPTESLEIYGGLSLYGSFYTASGLGISLYGSASLDYYPTESLKIYGGLSLYGSLYTGSSLNSNYSLDGRVSYTIAKPLELSAYVGLFNGNYSLGTGLNYLFTPSFGLGIYASYGNSFITPSTNANFTIGLQFSFIENPTPRVISAQFRP
jgi:hypothetical protein